MKVLILSLLATMLLTLPARAAELDEAVQQIVGGWRLDLTDPDGIHRTPILLVGRQIDEWVAWYADGNDLEVCKDVQLEDETLLLTIQPREFNNEVTVTLQGKLTKENECSGTAKYASIDGDSGNIEFTGVRIAPSDFRKVNRWALDFTTPDEERREATVTLLSDGDKWYGWYSSRQYELPIREITQEDDQLVFSLSAKAPNGADLDVTFRGNIDGESIRGSAEYDMQGDVGSFSFSGAAKSAE